MLHFQTVEPATLELLKELQSSPFLEKFYLVGGTAIALHLGHRMSIDLDLFSFEDFDSSELYEKLRDKYQTVEDVITSDATLLCFINKIKTDFIRYKYPPSSPAIIEEGIRLLALDDLVSMKLSAIAGRGKKKDFYDIYFLLRHYTIPQMIELYEAKFEAASVFHLLKSLVYFEDAEPDAEPILFEKITWATVKKAIQQKVMKL
ncbi:MAG: nucleotidyl transferase AbiEii/AbiGii toxin family protein [Saprospiraceae bacterium]|nr:nucleotidyl transferase AbiEii/AbiGii toxin family protein [Saprospiraceae bacterium]MCF8249480.1 nucleotidyl transferase AbiEii/AbiGii toxin family protein [Saprospiraceae bacterium]MCF8283163.1 nucleotidyl transferase AbiEii/AbiGii toxin family protein [Bacteroidales bacterium]MCF8310698.1 nucleotidyl transferase AbiEii/AbiGii toxin family protein [Saprospiraceae bacterium]MCF8439471.1 nucleotidyl transferase AbiEii/AbiGii toxin family protein [Saprospiraceae bacterium]